MDRKPAKGFKYRFTHKEPVNLFGCLERMSVFWDSDFVTYGNLPGIRFERRLRFPACL